MESVVEDIEALNFDQYGRYEMQQRDWRWGLEEVAAGIRGKYSTAFHLNYMRTNCLNPNYYEGEKLFVSTPDTKNLEEVESLVSLVWAQDLDLSLPHVIEDKLRNVSTLCL